MVSRFKTTRWSIVLAAGEGADAALSTLCHQYWYPLYLFVRRQGHDPQQAQDLTQGFFARLLEKRDLAVADPARGRFRSWLIGAAKHYLANEWDKAHAQKRGGTELEAEARYAAEPADERTPEYFYERRCALALIERAQLRLREESASRGNEKFFEQVRGCLADQSQEPDYPAVAKQFDLTAAVVKSRVWRLRKRWVELVREEVANTVQNPAEVDEEIRHLAQFLS